MFLYIENQILTTILYIFTKTEGKFIKKTQEKKDKIL